MRSPYIKILAGLLLVQTFTLKSQTINNMDTTKKINGKVTVEIWSDVMCPFCYIGKRKFEAALDSFPSKDQVEIVWKSFQLNPNQKTDPNKNATQYLAEIKGWSYQEAESANNYVTEMAKGVGLNYQLNKAVVANSFDAHRLIQYAKTQGKGDAAEERLFKAYFTEGENTADHTTLLRLAKEIGLDENACKRVLESNEFAEAVRSDVNEGEQLGLTGVPFFVINRRYAVSGAQDVSVFLKSLNKAVE